MRTYTHAILAYLLYLKATTQQKLLAVIGAITPDIFLALGYPFHFLPKTTTTSALHNLFHHSLLHNITKLFHSLTFVLPLLLISYLLYKKALPFFIGILSHVILDLFTHQQMGYNIFYPLTFPILSSPISYTSVTFTIFEHLFVLGFVVWFIKKKNRKHNP